MKPVIVVESQLLIEPLPTARPAEYAVVARLTQAFRRLLPGLRYAPAHRDWEMADFEHRPLGWPKARRFVVARRLLSEEEAQPTLFALGRYVYRAWGTNLSLTPAGIWHFYDGRAAMELRIGELRDDYALRKIPTRSFEANLSTWRSFVWPTTWSRRSNASACKNHGRT